MHTGNARLDVQVSLPSAVYIVKRFANLGVTPQGGSDEATVHHGLSVLIAAAPDDLIGSASGPAAGSGHSREPHS